MKEKSTVELVVELSKREAVNEIIVSPYDKIEIKVNGLEQKLDIDGGPARILVIYD